MKDFSRLVCLINCMLCLLDISVSGSQRTVLGYAESLYILYLFDLSGS